MKQQDPSQHLQSGNPKFMDPLGHFLFQERPSIRPKRSQYAREIQQPVPGYPTLAVNVMARIWNSIPELENAFSVGAAMSISKKWARTIPR